MISLKQIISTALIAGSCIVTEPFPLNFKYLDDFLGRSREETSCLESSRETTPFSISPVENIQKKARLFRSSGFNESFNNVMTCYGPPAGYSSCVVDRLAYNVFNIVSDVLGASELSGIDPCFLYSSAVLEGVMHGFTYNDENREYIADSTHPMGLDTIGERLESHVKKGYLPESFLSDRCLLREANERERGSYERLKWVEFRDIESAITALGADLRHFSKVSREDISALNSDSLTREEEIFWTYLYFHAGEGGARRILRNYGVHITRVDNGPREGGEDYVKVWHGRLLLQTYTILQEGKIF